MKRQLVIIPGWSGTKQSWKKFAEIAQNDFEVFCLEMPCFGDNPCPKDIWGVAEYADYVAEKIANLEKPIILGHSFGGQIAVNLVSRKKDVCGGLVLSGAAVLRPKNNFKKVGFSLLAKIGKIIFSLPVLNKLENLAKKGLYKLADSPDYNKTEGIKREIFKKVVHQSQEEKLPNIQIPTMVVWGSRDSYIPLAEGKKIASVIPKASLKIIKGGKHGLHIQEPEKLLEAIKIFSLENQI